MFNISLPITRRPIKFKYHQKTWDKYDCPVGYSGHEPSVSPSIVAVALLTV